MIYCLPPTNTLKNTFTSKYKVCFISEHFFLVFEMSLSENKDDHKLTRIITGATLNTVVSTLGTAYMSENGFKSLKNPTFLNNHAMHPFLERIAISSINDIILSYLIDKNDKDAGDRTLSLREWTQNGIYTSVSLGISSGIVHFIITKDVEKTLMCIVQESTTSFIINCIFTGFQVVMHKDSK